MTEDPTKELARRLMVIYNERMIPNYLELNQSHSEGFTREKMHGNPESLYQMIILASYDRRPFTIIARGWEPIWGISATGLSLPAILRGVGIFDLKSARALAEEDIERRLAGCSFYGYKLHSDGASTRYAKTLKDVMQMVDNGLLPLIESAKTSSDVICIHTLLDSIHGIGPTIASKLVKYTLREIRLGNIDNRELYPAVKPILAEFHNARLAKELMDRLGDPDLVQRAVEALKELGDPFAIDALYYVDRDEPQLKEFLLSGLSVPKSAADSRRNEDTDEKKDSVKARVLSIPDKVRQSAMVRFSSRPFSRRALQQATEKLYGPINHDSFLVADWTVNQKSGYEMNQKSGLWQKRHPILFKRNDGLYEMYDPVKHGTWTLIDGTPKKTG